MTTNKKLLAAAMTVALGTSVAHANLDMSDFYVLGGMGVGILDDAKVDGNEVKDDTTFAWRLGAGWMYNDYFGLELNYIHFNEASNTYHEAGNKFETTIGAQSIPLLAVVKAPVNDFALFAKLGTSYNIIDTEVKVNGVKGTDTDKKWEFAYGFGGEYNFAENMAVQVEYLVTGEDTSAVLGNLAYKF